MAIQKTPIPKNQTAGLQTPETALAFQTSETEIAIYSASPVTAASLALEMAQIEIP